jgi:hypothetical protein
MCINYDTEDRKGIKYKLLTFGQVLIALNPQSHKTSEKPPAE